MKLTLLRYLLLLDAVVLFLMGVLLIFVPKQVELAFQFKELPEGVGYIIGLWGSVLVTTSFGYVVAAKNPIRHVVWVQVGIARGVLELVLGLVYLARGIVTFHQAGFGIIIAGLIALSYVALYPPKPRLIRGTEGADSCQTKPKTV
jgi:hypothetical protein